MNQFYVGQKVACIRATYNPEQRVSIPCELTEGAIYTIRWVGMFNNYVDGDFLGVRLVEVERGVDPTYGYDDPPFRADRFRPLVKDPIALFRQIAADPSWKVDGEEGPVRGKPDNGERIKEKELEDA